MGGVKVIVGETQGGSTVLKREGIIVREVLVFLERGDIDSLEQCQQRSYGEESRDLP